MFNQESDYTTSHDGDYQEMAGDKEILNMNESKVRLLSEEKEQTKQDDSMYDEKLQPQGTNTNLLEEDGKNQEERQSNVQSNNESPRKNLNKPWQYGVTLLNQQNRKIPTLVFKQYNRTPRTETMTPHAMTKDDVAADLIQDYGLTNEYSVLATPVDYQSPTNLNRQRTNSTHRQKKDKKSFAELYSPVKKPQQKQRNISQGGFLGQPGLEKEIARDMKEKKQKLDSNRKTKELKTKYLNSLHKPVKTSDRPKNATSSLLRFDSKASLSGELNGTILTGVSNLSSQVHPNALKVDEKSEENVIINLDLRDRGRTIDHKVSQNQIENGASTDGHSLLAFETKSGKALQNHGSKSLIDLKTKKQKKQITFELSEDQKSQKETAKHQPLSRKRRTLLNVKTVEQFQSSMEFNQMNDSSMNSVNLNESQGFTPSVKRKEIKQKTFEKLSVSRIDKEFEQLSKQERLERMVHLVNNVAKQNKSNLQGKEVRFENKSSYMQCIKNPINPDKYILVADVKIGYQNNQNLILPVQNEEMKLFNQSGPQLIKYVTAEQKIESLDEQKLDEEDTTLISFWSSDQSQEFQCMNIQSCDNMIKSVVNKEKNLGQALFQGLENDIYYFSYDDQAFICLNIVDITNSKYDNDVMRRSSLIGNQVFQNLGKTQTIRKYKIQKNSMLEEQLTYQFLEHKQKHKQQYSLPKPTIITYDSNEYLILTVLQNEKPSLCLFEIKVFSTQFSSDSDSDSDSEKLNGNELIIKGEPTFQLDGAEIFLSSDIEDNIYFLTNMRLLSNLEKESKQESSSYSRLISPSVVKKVTMEQLKQLKAIRNMKDIGVAMVDHTSEEEIALSQKYQRSPVKAVYDDMETWSLSVDSKSMNFFRSQSHLYPQLIAIHRQKMNSLILQFNGNETLQSAAIHFQLSKDRQDLQNLEDIVNLEIYNETLLTGHYIHQDDDEELKVTLKVIGADASGNEISPDSHGQAKSGRKFKVEKTTMSNEWTFEEWYTSQANHASSKHPFQITRLEFDTETGDIISGAATLEGINSAVKLVLAHKDDEEYSAAKNMFNGEKHFKLNFMNNNGEDVLATIQGFYINRPFNSVLVGHFFKDQDLDNEIDILTSFMISKRTLAKLSFDDEEFIDEYYVEIRNGKVFDQLKQIKLVSEKKTGHFFEDVHQIFSNLQGVFILYGSLQKLFSGTKTQSGDKIKNDDYILSISQLSSIQKGKQRTNSIKDFRLFNSETLKEIFQNDSFKNQDGVIQGFKVSQTLDVTFSILQKFKGQNTVRFIQESLKQTKKVDSQNRQDLQKKEPQGLVDQTWATDYPLIAYNSHLPDNSQIIVQNFADKENFQQVLNLGSWKFLCFVQSVCLSQTFDDLNPYHCQILFLAKHTKIQKLRLMLLDQDPWSNKRKIELSVIATCEIKLPPLPVEAVKSVHLLSKKSENQPLNLALLFQYNDVMWSVSLRQPDRVSLVFEKRKRRVMPRYAIRQLNDTDQVYCITESPSKSEIVKISLSSIEQQEIVQINPIYESHQAKILIIEPDPDCVENLFVIENEQKVVKIAINGEGKANIIYALDVSHHNLEDELATVEQKPWTSVPVCDRTIIFEDYCFSLKTKFQWKDKKISEGEVLIEKRNLQGTLYSIQLQKLQNGKNVFRCQPLPGSNLVDLIGQSRTNQKTKLFFLTENEVLLHIENKNDNRFIIFDQQGYHLDKSPEGLVHSCKIVLESIKSQEYGKFFLMKDSVENYAVYQSNEEGLIKLQKFCLDSLRDKLTVASQSQLAEKMISDNKNRDALLMQLEEQIISSLQLHENQIMISKRGQVIILASVVIDIVDESLTIFEKNEMKEMETNEESQEYKFSKNLIGLFQQNHINVLLIPCKTKSQQNSLMKEILNQRQRMQSADNSQGSARNKKSEKQKRRSFKYQNTLSFVNKIEEQEHFTFGIVDTKLVWLTFERNFIQHIELENLIQNCNQNPEEFVWDELQSCGFPVNGILSDFTLDDFYSQGLHIHEIAEESILRKKEIELQNDRLCLMQLTVGNNVTIYNLSEQMWKEVSLMRDIQRWENPLMFQNTGFEYNMSHCTLKCNISQTLGIRRPFPTKTSRGLFRAISEMDLIQVQTFLKICFTKPTFTKAEFSDIETNCFLTLYAKETFFSIFAEFSQVFESVLDNLKALQQNQRQEDGLKGSEYNLLMESIYMVLTRPTPVFVREKIEKYERDMGIESKIIHPTDLSILRQSLLFEDSRSTVTIFEIAEIVSMSITDYILCIGDLKIILKNLPSNLYRKLLSQMDENAYTIKKTEAIMAKRGPSSNFKTFIQQSAILDEKEPCLDIHRNHKDDEVKKSVNITVLPLQWIKDEDGSQAVLFNFFRDNLGKLEGSLLLDAIFDAFWDNQQKKILRYVFYPYLLYFLVALIYYYECMLIESGHNVSMIARACHFIHSESKSDCNFAYELEPIIRVIFLVLVCHQTFIEVFQMEKQGFLLYIGQRSNLTEYTVISLNFVVIMMMTFQVDMFKVRPIASIAVVLLWVQMFFWFRLFDSLAQYVDLILQTYYDIRHFMYVLFTMMLMFTSGLYVIQINRMQMPEEVEEKVYPFTEKQGSLFIEGLFYMYKMILGDWSYFVFERETDGYEDKGWIELESFLVIFYFIGSTFFTQIVILNMLIAIMGATFSNHIEDQHHRSQRQKLILQAEFSELVDFYKKCISCCGSCFHSNSSRNAQSARADQTGYLFIIKTTSTNEEYDDGDTNGDQGQQLQQILDAKFRDQESYNKKVLRGLQDLTQETRDRLNGIEKSNQKREDSNKDSLDLMRKELMQRLNVLKDEIREIRDQVASNNDKQKPINRNPVYQKKKDAKEKRQKSQDKIIHNRLHQHHTKSSQARAESESNDQNISARQNQQVSNQ